MADSFWECAIYWQFNKEDRNFLLSAIFGNNADIGKLKEVVEEMTIMGDLSNINETFLFWCFFPELSEEDKKKWLNQYDKFLTDFPEAYSFDSHYLCQLVNFVNDLTKYIEYGIVPVTYTRKMWENAKAYKELESRNYELTPEQQARADKINEVCGLAGNNAWQLLLNAGVIKWKDNADDLAEPFCELNERYRNGSANNALLLFCVCSVNEMLEIYKEDKTEHWKPTNGYNTMVINPQIETLFGKEMKQAIAAAKRDNDISKYKRLPFGYKNVLKAVEKKTET